MVASYLRKLASLRALVQRCRWAKVKGGGWKYPESVSRPIGVKESDGGFRLTRPSLEDGLFGDESVNVGFGELVTSIGGALLHVMRTRLPVMIRH